MGTSLWRKQSPSLTSNPRGNGRRCRLAGLVTSILLSSAAALGQTKPNLIFIVTDDQGIDAFEGPAWPNDLSVHTPQLANLAERGRSFRIVRVNPLCSPTRSCLMTGRSANETGIYHIVREEGPPIDRIKRSLQTQEWTIAEALHASGYYTALVGKWHLGIDNAGGTTPEQQGFDTFVDGSDFIRFDDPINVGDELITMMVDQAVDKITNRPDPNKPYALFFWSNDPHERIDPSGREPLGWWRVDQSLLPSGEPYYHQDRNLDTERDRYRAVVEALDTEIGRMLRELGVENASGQYLPASKTVVLAMGDNGTPPAVLGGTGKGSLYESGVRVPLIAFGEQIPADGQILDRLVGAVDFFDTLGDIAGVSPADRGAAPRESVSFASDIGWGAPGPNRLYTLSSRGPADQVEGQWIALADQHYKLIARAGYVGFTPRNKDLFYDLAADPLEDHDLIVEGMNNQQRAAYEHMRDVIVDQWCSSVGVRTSLQVDIPLTDAAAVLSNNTWYNAQLPLGERYPSRNNLQAISLFRFDIHSIASRLPQGKTLADVESAQIILVFNTDARTQDETDIGPIRAFPVRASWWQSHMPFAQLKAAISTNQVGLVDLPAHLLPNSGQPSPITQGSLISLGRNADLLTTVRLWDNNPGMNDGVALVADRLTEVSGDQFVILKSQALLRLTLRP